MILGSIEELELIKRIKLGIKKKCEVALYCDF